MTIKQRSGPQQILEGGSAPLLGRMYEVEAARQLETQEIDRSEPVAASVAADPMRAFDTESASRLAGERTEVDESLTLPFIGEILHHVAGASITVERPLALAEDLHLADHAFVHAPGIKPLSACLPVLPMTMSLEIMAEVAACLTPGHGLIGFEDVKAARWIELADTDRLSLRIAARNQRFDAERQTWHIATSIYIEQQTVPAISANVLFAPHYRLDLALGFSEFTNLHRYPLSADEIYRDRFLFHGPSYQCLSGEILLGDRGAAGELLVRSPARLFRSVGRPQLLTDPTLLDAVGQLIGIWAMVRERYVFPIGIKKLEIYRATPPAGARVPVRVEITRDDIKTLHADIEVQDGAGAVWMRIQDWAKWKFRWERRLLDFRRLPTRYALSRCAELPILSRAAVCQILSSGDLAGFDDGMLARFCLHSEEMAVLTAKASVPQRQHQWLLGRITAKDAVRRWLARRAGTDELLHPAAFTIENDAHGQPRVGRLAGHDPLPHVSIAHCEDRAIAIAHGGAVGVDIERIRGHDAGFLPTISTESERRLLEPRAAMASPADARAEWMTRLWCAKEVAGKLLGTGIDGALQRFEAMAIDADGTIEILSRGSGRMVVANTTRDGDFIIACATAHTLDSASA